MSRVSRAGVMLALALALTFQALPPRPTLEGQPAKPALIRLQPNCGSTATCP